MERDSNANERALDNRLSFAWRSVELREVSSSDQACHQGSGSNGSSVGGAADKGGKRKEVIDFLSVAPTFLCILI